MNYNISKKFLIKEYIEKQKSLDKIAKKVNCNRNIIKNQLIKYGILIRTRSESAKNRFKDPKNHPMFERDVSKTTRTKMSKKKIAYFKTHRSPNYIDNRTKTKHYCIESNCSNELSYTSWRYGNKRCNSCAGKNRWQKKEYREKQLKASMEALHLTPNKPERLLDNLFKNLFPNEYKYVGNGEVILGGFNPDFININGQKKIIELYGDYWHNLPNYKIRDKKRLGTYKKYGYKTLIIWEHELKDKNKIKIKIRDFHNA